MMYWEGKGLVKGWVKRMGEKRSGKKSGEKSGKKSGEMIREQGQEKGMKKVFEWLVTRDSWRHVTCAWLTYLHDPSLLTMTLWSHHYRYRHLYKGRSKQMVINRSVSQWISQSINVELQLSWVAVLMSGGDIYTCTDLSDYDPLSPPNYCVLGLLDESNLLPDQVLLCSKIRS